jgi:hypothetical protein
VREVEGGRDREVKGGRGRDAEEGVNHHNHSYSISDRFRDNKHG